MTRPSYHHGALREALLKATLELIESEGIGAVSLRKVARAAGVSPGAPYHHFADRAALLTALSDEGFQLLATALTEAHTTAHTPPDALEAMLRAYLAFAETHPAYFRLMFRPELKQSKSESGEEVAESAFEVVEQTVAECLTRNPALTVHKDVLALALWSLVHGLAALTLDGQLEHRTPDPTTTTNQIITLAANLLRGQ